MTAQIASVQDVLDDGFLLATEHQLHLASLVGTGTPYDTPHGGRYDVDLGAGTLSFSGPSADPVVVRAHLVGSAAPGPGTWLWGWENLNGFPEAVVAYAEHVRAFGERFAIPELTGAQQPLRGTPREDAQTYAAVAATVCGGMATYTCEVGGGTVVALLADGPDLVLPAPSAVRAAALLPETAAAGVVQDWRRAVASYGRMRGFEVVEEADGTTLRAGDGEVVASFDDLGRLSGVRGSLVGNA